MKSARPQRIWLELDEIRSLLDAAGNHRALVATMILSGLRVGELCALRWRAVDLARGVLKVENAKTDAGERKVDLTPDLLGELKLHRQASPLAGPDSLVFATQTGSQRDRNNVRSRVLLPALARANAARTAAGMAPIVPVRNHTLRRTFASLLYEAVMAAMGHEKPSLALEVYTKRLGRQSDDTGKLMDALLRAPEQAPPTVVLPPSA